MDGVNSSQGGCFRKGGTTSLGRIPEAPWEVGENSLREQIRALALSCYKEITGKKAELKVCLQFFMELGKEFESRTNKEMYSSLRNEKGYTDQQIKALRRMDYVLNVYLIKPSGNKLKNKP